MRSPDSWNASYSVSPVVVVPRVIRTASAKPFVVTRAVLAPSWVNSVFSPTVVAWKNKRVERSSSSSPARPRLSAASRRASRTPDAKSGGVDAAFPTEMEPPPSTTTQSVNVPPMSMPTM